MGHSGTPRTQLRYGTPSENPAAETACRRNADQRRTKHRHPHRCNCQSFRAPTAQHNTQRKHLLPDHFKHHRLKHRYQRRHRDTAYTSDPETRRHPRRRTGASRWGVIRNFLLTNRQYAFARHGDHQAILTAANNDDNAAYLQVPLPFHTTAEQATDLITGKSFLIDKNTNKIQIELEGNSAVILGITEG